LRQALHAERLGLVHPVSRRPMSWQADPPRDIRELIDTLREASAASHRSPLTGHRSRDS
jgi:hypothetical protein